MPQLKLAAHWLPLLTGWLHHRNLGARLTMMISGFWSYPLGSMATWLLIKYMKAGFLFFLSEVGGKSDFHPNPTSNLDLKHKF
jgi:hypothetical protein